MDETKGSSPSPEESRDASASDFASKFMHENMTCGLVCEVITDLLRLQPRSVLDVNTKVSVSRC